MNKINMMYLCVIKSLIDTSINNFLNLKNDEE